MQVCLADWTDEDLSRRFLGVMKGADGMPLYDVNGPVRIFCENGKYNTYEDFHGTDEWREIWKQLELG